MGFCAAEPLLPLLPCRNGCWFRGQRLAESSLAARAGDRPISDFEFNSVVISILIAFALSEVLASWGSLIKGRPSTQSWLYIATSVLLVRLLVGHWLGLSAYRSIEHISPAQSLLIFSPSFIAALAAFILAPDRNGSEAIDLSAHYSTVSRWVFTLLAAFVLLAGLSDLLIPGEEPLPFLFYLLWAGALLIPAFVSGRRVHATVIAASFLGPPVFAVIREIIL